MTHKILTLHIVLIIAVAIVGSSQAAKLYKWVDANGNVSYQDSPPPKDAKVLEESELKRSNAPSSQSQSDLPPIVVYTVDNCDACDVLLLRLKQLEIPHQQASLLNKEVQAEILSNNDAITAPALKIGEQYLNNITESELLSSLRDAGYNPEVASNQTEPASAQQEATNSGDSDSESDDFDAPSEEQE